MKYDMDEPEVLVQLLYEDKITVETYKKISFLYEITYTGFLDTGRHKEITFNYKDFIDSYGDSLDLELLEESIKTLAELNITELYIDFQGEVSVETKKYIYWLFKFFYYQYTKGNFKNTQELDWVFRRSSYLPYKFDISELSYQRKLSIFFLQSTE